MKEAPIFGSRILLRNPTALALFENNGGWKGYDPTQSERMDALLKLSSPKPGKPTTSRAPKLSHWAWVLLPGTQLAKDIFKRNATGSLGVNLF